MIASQDWVEVLVWDSEKILRLTNRLDQPGSVVPNDIAFMEKDIFSSDLT